MWVILSLLLGACSTTPSGDWSQENPGSDGDGDHVIGLITAWTLP